MSHRRVTAVGVSLVIALAVSACSSSSGRFAPAASGTGSTGGNAGAAGTAGAAGAAGASGGAAGSTGPDAGPDVDLCGNGVAEPGEACDQADLGGRSCEKLGFLGGVLACSPSCTLDTSGCTGGEQCNDGADNDGDGLVDCHDPNCASACADACSAPSLIGAASAVVDGNNAGHSSLLGSACANPAQIPGPEVVYAVDVTTTGVLEAELSTKLAAYVSVRSSCADTSSELACDGERVKLSVTQGQKLFLVVKGSGVADQGDFTLLVDNRAIVCGDGHLDPGEECDDANTAWGDGCGGTCKLEASETEPNDKAQSANTYASPWFAQIAPAGDRDFVELVVGDEPTSLIADTFDFGDGSCAFGWLDSVLELRSPAGKVLATDDDSGAGLCAHLALGGLGKGTYWVSVAASPSASVQTFPYRLAITLDRCGNGVRVETEACDDGNNLAGDGCSPTCTLE